MERLVAEVQQPAPERHPRSLEHEVALVDRDVNAIRGATAEHVRAGERGLFFVGNWFELRRPRIPEPLEIAEDRSRGGAACFRVCEQRNAVRPWDPLHAGLRGN